MCVSIIEAHLCGWRGSEIRKQPCEAAVAISRLVVLTDNDVQLLQIYRRECEQSFKESYLVRIGQNCSICSGLVEILGELQAQLDCVNMANSSRTSR
jgi:hypothetical protein